MKKLIIFALILSSTVVLSQNKVVYNNYFVMSNGKVIQENRQTELIVEYSSDGYSGISVTYAGGNIESFELLEILNSDVSYGSTTARYVERTNRKTYIIRTYNDQTNGICIRKADSQINACYNKQ